MSSDLIKRRPYTCKFCRQQVWYHIILGTMQHESGDEKHLPHCPRKSAHYKSEALTRGEQARQQRHQ